MKKKLFLITAAVLFGLGAQNAGAQTEQGVNINGVIWATKNVGATAPQQWGNYYTWDEACKVCPTGWRLPTEAELKSLISTGSV